MFILWYHICMNDNTKVLDQNPGTPPTPVQPVSSVGGANKEMGRVAGPVSEFVKLTEAEPQIDKELADLGVEVKKDSPNVTEEHRDFIDHAKQFTAVSTSASGKVTMPMSEEEVADQLKTGQDDDSKTGLAKLIDKVIKALGL